MASDSNDERITISNPSGKARLDDEIEISAKLNDRTHRLIDDITNLGKGDFLPDNRKSFIEGAITGHIDYILQQVEGQKSIRDFAKDLSADISWINIDPDTKFKLNTKFDPDKSLPNSPDRIEITQSEKDRMDQILKCTDLGTSDVVRLCVIRHLYELTKDITVEDKEYSPGNEPIVEGMLTKTKTKAIAERWLDLDNKLEMVVNELIYQLYNEVTSPKFQELSRYQEYSADIRAIIDHYEYDFKGTTGYRVMKDDRIDGLGEVVISELDAVVEEMEDEVK